MAVKSAPAPGALVTPTIVGPLRGGEARARIRAGGPAATRRDATAADA